jgi:hypothetical protein
MVGYHHGNRQAAQDIDGLESLSFTGIHRYLILLSGHGQIICRPSILPANPGREPEQGCREKRSCIGYLYCACCCRRCGYLQAERVETATADTCAAVCAVFPAAGIFAADWRCHYPVDVQSMNEQGGIISRTL